MSITGTLSLSFYPFLFPGKPEEPPPLEEETEDAASTNVSNKIVLEAYLNNLPNCVNREMIDNAAIDFLVTLNSKHNRKKLVRTLFGVNRTRLDLLPFYARFVAILHPAVPEVANELCQMLRQDFKFHVRKKDQINIESKIKVTIGRRCSILIVCVICLPFI